MDLLGNYLVVVLKLLYFQWKRIKQLIKMLLFRCLCTPRSWIAKRRENALYHSHISKYFSLRREAKAFEKLFLDWSETRRGYRRSTKEAETLLGQDNYSYSYSNQRLGWGWDKSSVMRQQTFHLGPGKRNIQKRSPKWQHTEKKKSQVATYGKRKSQVATKLQRKGKSHAATSKVSLR